jgi:hypothetical protein
MHVLCPAAETVGYGSYAGFADGVYVTNPLID